MKGHSLLILILFFCLVSRGQRVNRPTLFVTGIVCDRDSARVLPGTVYRWGKEAHGVDKEGRFSLDVHVGDTLRFSHVGYMPVDVVISDSLKGNDFLLGIFLVRDTILLSEVLILPRFFTGKYKPKPYALNARNNFNQALHAATLPVKEMDREMNREMVLQDFARKVEMKGMVDVKLGVGISSLTALHGLLRGRRNTGTAEMINVGEIDLLKKIFYIEKERKSDN